MEIKHVVVLKFNESASEEQIEDCIKQYGKLVDLIPSIKAFKWYATTIIRIISCYFIFQIVFELFFRIVL